MMLPAASPAIADAKQTTWNADGLPPFPAVALKALKLLSGTDSSLLQLCDLIRFDPAFSGAVLRLANSPLVAFPKNVTSVLQASMLLGFQRLRSAVITYGLKAYLSGPSSPVMRSCWRHSVAAAILAERSAKWSFLDSDFAHTAAILHDMGRVGLATLMPAAYAQVVARGAERPLDLLAVERELCGIDHCQAGGSLLAAWNVPAALVEVAEGHHHPGPELRGAAALVAPSCELADALGFAAVPCRGARSYAEVLADYPKAARKHFPAAGEWKALAAEVATEIKVIESV